MSQALTLIAQEVRSCTKCRLHEGTRNGVPGEGNAESEILFVGEGPGFHEDAQGRPFVGPAGKLLNEMLARAGLKREDVFITNIVKHRPPGNRDPMPDEIESCKPYLYKQIDLIEPKVICTLGNFATKLLTGSPRGITKVHGDPQPREIAGRMVILYPLFHPAAALRSTSVLDLLRADIHRLPELIAEHVPEPAADEEQLGLFG